MGPLGFCLPIIWLAPPAADTKQERTTPMKTQVNHPQPTGRTLSTDELAQVSRRLGDRIEVAPAGPNAAS